MWKETRRVEAKRVEWNGRNRVLAVEERKAGAKKIIAPSVYADIGMRCTASCPVSGARVASNVVQQYWEGWLTCSSSPSPSASRVTI